jgi:hypothetical protein
MSNYAACLDIPQCKRRVAGISWKYLNWAKYGIKSL